MREIILDTETTGLDPASGHRIIEIGCVEIFNKVKTGAFFQVYINPERDVPMEAFKIHGISSEFLKDKKKFAKIAHEFLEFIGDTTLVIHNARFDLKFLNFELKKISLPEINIKNVVDTLDMARRKFPGSPASLDALCKRFNINLSKRDKHGALLDSELLAEVYLGLCGGAQAQMSYEEEVLAQGPESSSLYDVIRPVREKRDFAINNEELEAHKEFLKSIKNPMWENN